MTLKFQDNIIFKSGVIKNEPIKRFMAIIMAESELSHMIMAIETYFRSD